ncbi:MAG: hypothetical protein KA988_00685 [Longilinea sp.]|nr:hypothetical protein [Longilinea sp.]MCA1953954.1 hypothetical protein [Anaerolinea sp.]
MIELPSNGHTLFRRTRAHSNPYRVLLLLFILLGFLFIYREWDNGVIVSPLDPTPTPTRTLDSYALEAATHFQAGNLNKAISAYQFAASLQPNDAHLWADLARVQVYSSRLLTNDTQRQQRLEEALASADKAVEANPEDSYAHAVRALVLDWYGQPVYVGDRSARLMAEAEAEATRALQLDNTNALALAYYAEILADQQKLTQAEQYIRQAIERNPNLMDVHRVNAYVQESLTNYNGAIQEYERAIELTPNLTFLYIDLGVNLRHLKQYDRALESFTKAVNINKQLGVLDPIPYLAIGKTYSQTGDFFAASLNVRKALEIEPATPDVYGQLGIVYFKSRNYEGAILALQCAVRGCDPEVSCEVRRCDPQTDPAITIQGMPLNSNTVVYYYTYGSALAGMHRESNGYCAEAVKVLREVRNGFSNDPIILQIIAPSEEICAGFGYK